MSRRAILFPFALFLAAPLAAAPVPPRPKLDDSLSTSAVWLLKHRKVQKELKMSAEHRVELIDAMADIDEEYTKKLDALFRVENAPDEAFAKLDTDREEASEKALAATAKKLTGAQRNRLRQLDRRVRGPAAFLDPQVQNALQLTAAQKKKAADAAEKLKAEVKRFIEDANADNEDRQKANLFAFRKERLKELEGALSDDQKKAWVELLGPAPTGFDADSLWLRIEEEADEPEPLTKK